MDPKLIAAAAKLCGWEDEFVDDERMAWSDELTDAGLLALEDALLRRGWELFMTTNTPEAQFHWERDFASSILNPGIRHPDRATAACLAAQQEINDG
jgi:hypothetical protein